MKKAESVDISIVRNINSRALLDVVFSQEVTSRSALSQKLGMSKSAVSANLTPLIDSGIIIELGEGSVSVSGGRKPLLLTFNKNCKYIIAIDLNMSDPLFVIGNLKGEQLGEFTVKLESNISQNDYLKLLFNAISFLMDSVGINKEDVCYIGVAAPGVFDEHGRLCSQNRNYKGLRWKTLDLKSVLEEKFNIPVFIKNDVKTAALGEWAHSTHSSDNMLYISCGVGIGAGLILEGRLFDGFYNGAGEIYNYVDSESVKSGKTIEDQISIKWLLDKVNADISSGVFTSLSVHSQITFKHIVAAYREEDPYVVSIVEDIAGKLCVLITNLVNLLDIDSVIIGGEYGKFAPAVADEFEEKYLSFCRKPPKILSGLLKQYAGVQGIFLTARELYFENILK